VACTSPEQLKKIPRAPVDQKESRALESNGELTKTLYANGELDGAAATFLGAELGSRLTMTKRQRANFHTGAAA
jgi:hypothetical protein